jgi:hypothetical protein
MYLGYTPALNGRMTGEWWTRKDLKGSDRGEIQVYSWYLFGGTEENL